jgi:hypothetical protein
MRMEERSLHQDYTFGFSNSVQVFIIYVPSQQLRGQLQTQHSVGTGIIIIVQYNNNNNNGQSQTMF